MAAQQTVDHSNMKLGALPSKTDPRTLKFGTYLAPEDQLPTVPDEVTWGSGVKNWGMMKNNVCEDCAIAAQGHLIIGWADAIGSGDIYSEGIIDTLLGIPKKYVYGGLAVLGLAAIVIYFVKRKKSAT